MAIKFESIHVHPDIKKQLNDIASEFAKDLNIKVTPASAIGLLIKEHREKK